MIMTEKKRKKKVPHPPKEVTLDDLLINIQKSLSRVSNRSSEIPEDQARALIYGDVDFSIELQVEGDDDKVIVNKEGGY